MLEVHLVLLEPKALEKQDALDRDRISLMGVGASCVWTRLKVKVKDDEPLGIGSVERAGSVRLTLARSTHSEPQRPRPECGLARNVPLWACNGRLSLASCPRACFSHVRPGKEGVQALDMRRALDLLASSD